MAKCGPNRTICGMSQGIYNPFFQNGAPWYGSGGGESFDEDFAERLLEGTAQGDVLPSAANQTKQNTLTLSLKAGNNNWDKMAVAWLMANDGSETFGRLNLKNPATFRLQSNGTIAWDSNGSKGNGTNGFYDTQWNPFTETSLFTQNNNSFGVYCTDNVITATAMIFGAALLSTSGQGNILTPRHTGDITRAMDNNGTAQSVGTGITTSVGLTSVVRTASGAFQVYKNGVSIGTASVASNAIVNLVWYLLAIRSNAAAANFDTRRVGFAYAGRGDVDQLELYNSLLAYFS